MIKWLLILLVVCSVSCRSVDKERTQGLTKIDLESGTKLQKSANLSLIAKESFYIKLMGNDSVFVSNRLDVKISNRYLFVFDKSSMKLFEFSLSGELVMQIGRFGESPSQYQMISDFLIDDKSELVYLLDGRLRKVIAYDFNGLYKNYFPITGYPQKFFKVDKNFIFVTPSEGENTNEFPSVMLTNNSGQIIKSFKFPEHIKQDRYASFSFWKNSDSFFLWQETSDTAYFISSKIDLMPKYIFVDNDFMPKRSLFNNSRFKASTKYYFVMDRVFNTKKFLFIDGLFKERGVTLVYDKNSNTSLDLIYNLDIVDHGFHNDIDGGPPFWPSGQIDDDLLFQIWPPSRILKVYNSEYNRGIKFSNEIGHDKIDSLIKNLKPEDYPIIQFVKMK